MCIGHFKDFLALMADETEPAPVFTWERPNHPEAQAEEQEQDEDKGHLPSTSFLQAIPPGRQEFHANEVRVLVLTEARQEGVGTSLVLQWPVVQVQKRGLTHLVLQQWSPSLDIREKLGFKLVIESGTIPPLCILLVKLHKVLAPMAAGLPLLLVVGLLKTWLLVCGHFLLIIFRLWRFFSLLRGSWVSFFRRPSFQIIQVNHWQLTDGNTLDPCCSLFCSHAAKDDAVQKGIASKTVVAMNSTCNFPSGVKAWNCACAADAFALLIHFHTAHAIVDDRCDDGNMEGLRSKLRPRDHVVIELLAAASRATGIIPGLSTWVCWPLSSLRIPLHILGSLEVCFVNFFQLGNWNAHVLSKLCS
mmetsp:Transcript_74582/g.131927  ORF Transcript_74582/g.131927 Transcript_74582/m.131927 type:complete len:360 (+) Transcript_74582:33-1112(+)